MAELESQNLPLGAIASRHRPFAELEAAFRALPQPPTNQGQLAWIVCRRAPGIHEPLAAVRLAPEHGVPGDQWNERLPLKFDSQLTVMRRDVAELLAPGQPCTISGDNLVVDLDISTKNLPAGTRLRLGEAVLEVTSLPHNGCHKFRARFGTDALRFVQAPVTRPQNLRGIHCRVLAPGEIKAGQGIEVLERPALRREASSF